MLLAALFAGVALYLNANQVACGLALTIFGVGLSSFVGAAWVGKPLQGFARWRCRCWASCRCSGACCSPRTRWST